VNQDTSLGRPRSTEDLLLEEVRFAMAMQQMRYGRFEHLRIHYGGLVLKPWPTAVRTVKFGSTARSTRPCRFELKQQLVEFFEWVRRSADAEIRVLQVHDGLPVSMEVEYRSPGEGIGDA
jgi:hypothetical protein